MKKIMCISALGALLPTAALADEALVPSAELLVEWQHEYRANSDDPAIDDTHNSFIRSEFGASVPLNEHLSIDGLLVFEPFDQAASKNMGDDIWFESHGAYIEELKLSYADGPVALWAGKFDPVFGMAWDYGRGVWSEDFAEDYEIAEMLGAGAAYTIETENAGAHTLTGSVFFADTSFLSGSVITDRPQLQLSDGGASNTEDFSSFVLSLEGEDAGGVEGLYYQLAYRFLGEQDAGRSAATDDEDGIAATLNYATDINDDLGVDVLLEYAGLNSFGGVANADSNYYSASVITTIQQDWNVTVGYTLRDIRNDGSGASFDDTLLQLSGGYDFGNGLTAEGGWRGTEEANMDTDILGFLVRYTREF